MCYIDFQLIHSGLLMPYNDLNLGVTLAQVMACCQTGPSYHMRAISLQLRSIMILKILYNS